MTRHERNTAVKSGYYFNPATLNVVLVPTDGGRLPDEAGTWYAVPTMVALALAPVCGALFLMFLPMIGVVLVLDRAFKGVVSASSGSAGQLAAAVAPGWVPGEAHLAGKAARRPERKPEVDPLDLRLAALEVEIERRRRG
jgi:hypothetical protein